MGQTAVDKDKSVSLDFIEKHKKDIGQTKRLHVVLVGTNYIIHAKRYRVSDIRSENFPKSSKGFNIFLRNADMSQSVLVVIIERMKNLKFYAVEADWENEPEYPVLRQVSLDSAALSKIRFKGEMETFEQTVLLTTGKRIEELSVDTVLLMYVSMYATSQFSKLNDIEYLYKLLDKLPENGEHSFFVVW